MKKQYYVGSSDLLDYIYDLNGEKAFIKFCENFLKVKIKWIEERGQYEIGGK